LPSRWSEISDEALFVARAISIFLLYHAAVMMIGFPLPRYAISMRPMLYIMSMIPIAMATRWIMEKRSAHAGTV
jgi:hypothetical protein